MAKLTRWFPATVKPVRGGVYQTTFGKDRPGFSYWDGYFWHSTAGTPELASLHFYPSEWTQDKRWRGLASKP